MQKNDEYVVDIIDYGMNGEGIAKVDNFTIFVMRALKGEKCKIHITKVFKNFAYARVIEIIEKSSDRQKEDCLCAKQCGGCDLRHIKYEETLKIKKEKVQNLVNKYLTNKIVVEDTIGMDNPFYYRNKAIYQINNNKKMGFYKKRTHDTIEIEECKIHTKLSQKITNYILKNYIGEVYNEETEKGILRNIMIREGFSSGDIMIVMVQTNEKVLINLDELIENFPMIKTVIININNKKTNVILSDNNKVIYGEGYIYDYLGGYKFKISTNSFYQINPIQTEKLYSLSIKEANLNNEDILCDLYCGVGTIGLYASQKVKKAYGIEIIDDAINNAIDNAKLNNIENCSFIQGDVEFAFDKLLKNNVIPTVIILDPPRKGIDNTTIENLKQIRIDKIVYISCNPSTLVRDLAKLEEIYEVKKIIPVDMFPYTTHTEVISVLRLK